MRKQSRARWSPLPLKNAWDTKSFWSGDHLQTVAITMSIHQWRQLSLEKKSYAMLGNSKVHRSQWKTLDLEGDGFQRRAVISAYSLMEVIVSRIYHAPIHDIHGTRSQKEATAQPFQCRLGIFQGSIHHLQSQRDQACEGVTIRPVFRIWLSLLPQLLPIEIVGSPLNGPNVWRIGSIWVHLFRVTEGRLSCFPSFSSFLSGDRWSPLHRSPVLVILFPLLWSLCCCAGILPVPKLCFLSVEVFCIILWITSRANGS